jgi:hypothetical protein
LAAAKVRVVPLTVAGCSNAFCQLIIEDLVALYQAAGKGETTLL